MLLWDGDCGHKGMFFLGWPVVMGYSLVTSCVRVLVKRKWIFSFYLDGVECNGGPFWQAVSSYVRFVHHNFSLRNTTFLGVFSAGLLVISCTFGIMLNSGGNLYFNTLTFASVVSLYRGSIRLVSWQVLRASLGAISPQTQARRACQLDPKHSRFRVRTCSDNSGLLVSFGQEKIQSFTFV